MTMSLGAHGARSKLGASQGSSQRVVCAPWKGCRRDLMHLFMLADDSIAEIERYMLSGELLVAAKGQAIIGHAQLIPNERADEYELKSIAVLEEFQGQDVGSKLVLAAMRYCRDNGAMRMKVSTSIAAFDAIRFYLRRGFRISGFQRDAFTVARGYPADAELGGLPLNDAVEFELGL